MTSTGIPLTDLTTPAAARTIAANPKSVSRNLQITQSYHELTLAMARLLGGDDAGWPAFATWASKQAGSFIRNEEVPAPLRRFLGLEPGGRRPPSWSLRGQFLRKPFLTYARCTVEDVAANLADGNRIVYTKVGALFADFLELAREHPPGDDEALEEFLAGMEEEPSTGEALRRAFRQFWLARSESDAKLRAERIMVANLLTGLHEQNRLQEAIDGALSAPINTALDDPERKWTNLPVPMAVRRVCAALFRRLFAPAIRGFEDDWKKIATECLMTLAVPSEELKLGDDVPPLPDGSSYPPALEELTLTEAEELIVQIDYTPHELHGSGARDWTVLEQRMNYVADLFRSRQQERELLDPPFSPEQAAEIRAGKVPSGSL